MTKKLKLNVFTKEGVKTILIPYKKLSNYIKNYQLFEKKQILRKIIKESFKSLFEDYRYEYKGTYTPPQYVIDAAKRALGKSGEVNSDNANEGSGINKAKDLANGQPITHAQLKRMKAFFDNNENNKNLSWELWGGDEGRRWVEEMINQTNSSNDTSKTVRGASGLRTKTLMDPHNTRTHTAYSRIKNSLNEEGYDRSHQERFDRAIYLTYVEQRKDHDFKHVSKERFYKLMDKYNPTKMKSIDFNENNRHRIADKKITFLTKQGKIFAEVWSEKDVWSSNKEEGHATSYWVNMNFIQ